MELEAELQKLNDESARLIDESEANCQSMHHVVWIALEVSDQ